MASWSRSRGGRVRTDLRRASTRTTSPELVTRDWRCRSACPRSGLDATAADARLGNQRGPGLEGGERLPHDLIHLEVLVAGESANEGHVVAECAELSVLLVAL